MKLTESEIRTLILEEVRLHLLVEEIQADILNEGIVRWLKKTFGQSSWEDMVDDVSDDGKIENTKFLSLPSKQKVAALALMGLVLGSSAQLGASYMNAVSPAEAAAAEKITNSLETAQDRVTKVSNFRKMAQSEVRTGQINSQADVNDYLDDLRLNYQMKAAPIGIGAGAFIGGDSSKQATGFAYVPASEISDDTVLPFVGMTKADYETFLRMSWLAGGGDADERYKEFVTGGGKAGSSVRWSYQDSLYAPVADKSGDTDPDIAKVMVQNYGPAAETTLILPLEWSVAFDIMQKRAFR